MCDMGYIIPQIISAKRDFINPQKGKQYKIDDEFNQKEHRCMIIQRHPWNNGPEQNVNNNESYSSMIDNWLIMRCLKLTWTVWKAGQHLKYQIMSLYIITRNVSYIQTSDERKMALFNWSWVYGAPNLISVAADALKPFDVADHS